MTSKVPAVRCRGLTKRYGERAVVDALDLDVEQGEVFGFLGPNGSGKTTTARLLLGLIKPDGGEAWLLGSRVPCPERLAEIGALVEEPAFYSWLSGRRNLEIVGDEGGPLPRRAVDDALQLAGIAQAADTKVKTYSQGMRQRLGLAAAVLRRPALVLLDEPANGLDPAGTGALRDLLRHLAERGSTVFLSSHLLGEVEQVCHRVAIIHRGRLMSVMSISDFDSSAERTRVTVDGNEMAPARAALRRWAIVAETPGQLIVAGGSGKEINRALADAGIFAGAIVGERLTLEDRFLALTEIEGPQPDAAAAS